MIIIGILVFGLLVWLTYELIKQKEPSATFSTFTYTRIKQTSRSAKRCRQCSLNR